jgi:membrane-bound lytic murein transglycosylase B
MYKLYALLFLLVVSATTAGYSQTQPSFEEWISDVKYEARVAGISDSTLELLDNVTFNQRSIELDRKQPESRKTFDAYRAAIITSRKVEQARALYQENHILLNKIGDEYGVQPRFIIALWGIETNFGSNTGDFDIIDVLATLAYEGRRRDFFKKELFSALTMVDTQAVSADMMKGSWAGAMGQTQFMPSSFLKFAVDYDQDGVADIWRSKADIFASIANYLSSVGWDNTSTWGRAVRLPPGFDRSLAKITLEKTLKEWHNIGLRTIEGRPLPVKSVDAAVVIPGDGHKAFLAYANYKTLLDWNRSTFFATTVGLLADTIATQ